VLDMAALAPDAEAEEPVLDMAALAPDAEAEEPVLDMAALAPEPDSDPIFDMATLAPEPPPQAAGRGAFTVPAPDDIVIDMDALRTASSASDDDGSGDGEFASEEAPAYETGEASTGDGDEDEVQVPVYTRTLAELYVKQGALDRALTVLRHLRDRDPRDHDIARRIADLEAGVVESEPPSPVGAPRADEFVTLETDEEVETLARDLAQFGHSSHDVDSPFAWGESDPEEVRSGPTIRDYFQGMLDWEMEEPT
jgi:hypothetical protein